MVLLVPTRIVYIIKLTDGRPIVFGECTHNNFACNFHWIGQYRVISQYREITVDSVESEPWKFVYPRMFVLRISLVSKLPKSA